MIENHHKSSNIIRHDILENIADHFYGLDKLNNLIGIIKKILFIF